MRAWSFTLLSPLKIREVMNAIVVGEVGGLITISLKILFFRDLMIEEAGVLFRHFQLVLTNCDKYID